MLPSEKQSPEDNGSKGSSDGRLTEEITLVGKLMILLILRNFGSKNHKDHKHSKSHAPYHRSLSSAINPHLRHSAPLCSALLCPAAGSKNGTDTVTDALQNGNRTIAMAIPQTEGRERHNLGFGVVVARRWRVCHSSLSSVAPRYSTLPTTCEASVG